MGNLSVPWPFLAWMRRMCSRLFFRWPPIYVSSISTMPMQGSHQSLAMQSRKSWVIRCAVLGLTDASVATRNSGRSRMNVRIAVCHVSIARRKPRTGYGRQLNSFRHRLHFFFPRLKDQVRENPHAGHVVCLILVANLPIHVDIRFSWLSSEGNWHRVGGRVTDYP